MRIFGDCVTMISEVTRDLFSRGSIVFDPTVQGREVSRVDYEAKELIGYGYTLTSDHDKHSMIKWAKEHFPACDITIEWADAWFNDRISGKPMNPDPSWKLRKEYWKEYINDDGKMDYSYSDRMQMFYLIGKLLSENKYRRGAYQPIFEGYDLANAELGMRVPCSIGYHFICRPAMNGDRLHLLYYMRSCDLINHFPSDVYIALRLLDYVAENLEVKVGNFIHFISSLHAYIKDVPEDRRW